ncbi:MAG TPA: DUF1800 domain-containing protein [bacterium]|nr:DUF1800 domain-containing protein [bacterium]
MPGALDPFVPSAGDPWDARKAAHLLRRTGFGPLPDEVDRAVAAGPERTVDAIFAFPPDPVPPAVFDDVRGAEQQLESTLDTLRATRQPINLQTHPELRGLYQEVGRRHGRAIVGLAGWWLERMATSPAPLQEKLVLFWHGHFTSAFGDVHDAIAMFNQNQLFRRNAAGNFARLLDGVARDSAMLRYLNNDANRKGHPNENWARELMELFTMGIGHYTEDDVKESARAWTGWTLRDYRTGDDRRAFAFKPMIHDGGPKVFLGQAGAWDGADIMRIILAQDATPRWIARKMAVFFVSPTPDPSIVDAMARQLRASAYDLAPMLKTVFRSRAFYRPDVMLSQVKGPVEFSVGAVRHLGMNAPDWVRIFNAAGVMGQRLFFPPNVAGWHGGTAWINAGTIFARTDLASALVSGRLGPVSDAAFPTLDAAVTRLLARPLAPHRHGTLALATGGQASRTALHLLMSMPEYLVA